MCAVFAAGILAALNGCFSPASDERARQPPLMDSPVVTGDPAGFNAADVTFATTMLAYDQQEIDLAALVPQHSGASNIAAFALTKAADAQADMAVLRALRVQWNENPDIKVGGDGKPPTPPGLVKETTMMRLNTLQGNAFDSDWLQAITGLDQSATLASDAEVHGGKNVDAVDVARRTLQAKRNDLSRAQQLQDR